MMLEQELDRRSLLRGNWRTPASKPGVIRPPGAIGATEFHAACDGCGDCAEACPADAILMEGPATALARSSPLIDPVESPCVMCDSLVCSTVCKPRALVPVAPETMKIGRLVFNGDACWAQQGIDPNCDYCMDRCPLKGRAITYRQGSGPEFHSQVCTGCGVCVHYCPAQPAPLSIVAV